MKRAEIYVDLKTGKKKKDVIRYRLDEHLNYIEFERGCKIWNSVIAEHENNYDKYSSMVAAYLGITKNDLILATEDQLEEIYTACMQINDSELPGVYRVISVNNKFFKLRDLEDITVGQYITIDSLFEDESNRAVIAAHIAEMLYKPIARPVSKPKQAIIEGKLSSLDGIRFGGYGKVQRVKEGGDPLNASYLSTGYLMSALNYYLNYRIQLQADYDQIFDNGGKKQQAKFMDTKKAMEAWGWYAVVQGLCDNDDSKFDWWMNQPIRALLKKLVYLKTVKK